MRLSFDLENEQSFQLSRVSGEGIKTRREEDSVMTSLSTQPVKGMRDILGKQARAKKRIELIISQTAAEYGFEPMQVPVVENLSVLTAKGGVGEEAAKELYTFEDQSNRKLGLRFEFTTSLVRVVAGNPDLPKPIKALNMGTVYRYDNPQALRYREFTQADCDILGTKNESADAECISLAIDVMDGLGFEDYYVRVNDRRIVDELIGLSGIPPEKAKDAMRQLDKWDKIGMEGVKKELEDQKIPTTILSYLTKTLPQLKKILEKEKRDFSGVSSLEKIFEIVEAQKKLPFIKFDPSLVRGLDYYTGTVFEIFGGAKFSVGGGGRYDNFVKSMGGPDMPAVGISFGVDRLMDLLSEKWSEPSVDIYIIPIGKTFNESQWLASQLRENNFRVEIDLMQRNIGKNMSYANSKQVPVVLFLGENELAENSVKVRDMVSGEEKVIGIAPLTELEKYLTILLSKKNGK